MYFYLEYIDFALFIDYVYINPFETFSFYGIIKIYQIRLNSLSVANLVAVY